MAERSAGGRDPAWNPMARLPGAAAEASVRLRGTEQKRGPSSPDRPRFF